MQLKTYLEILWRRKWIIAIVTTMTLAVAIVGTLLIPPTFKATATLYVATTIDGTYNSGQTNYADRLKRTYATLATSDSFLKEVEQQLELTQEPNIEVDVLANTELMRVSVEYSHPLLAAEIANAIAGMIVDESLSTLQGQANPVEIRQPATEPTLPDKPNKKLNIALGAVVGLLGGLGLAFLVESFDTTLYTSEQIQKATALSVLGEVPKVGRQAQIAAHPLADGEAFRRIRINMLGLKTGEPLQTLLITSAMPGEGKSTVVANLGHVMAQAGKRVIVVDGDLRRPMLHTIFDLSNEIGLNNVLQEEVSLAEACQEIEGSQLHVLTSGSLAANPAELLASAQMKTLLQEMEAAYDVVLFDSPALTAVPDAAVLAPIMGGVLLVVGQAQARHETVAATQQQLAMVNTKPIGVIINRTKQNRSYQYYNIQPQG